MLQLELNYLAIAAAAAINIGIGAAWYSPLLFGRQWTALMGKNARDLKAMQATAGRTYLFSAVGALVSAFVLAQAVLYAAAVTPLAGAAVGFWLWLGLVAAPGIMPTVFEGRRTGLYLIFTGYQLVAFLAMGAVLAQWV